MDKTRIRLILLVAALSVILGGLIGGVAAKYIWSTELTGKVTFSAKLAESITLRESVVGRQDDGSYALSPSSTDKNSYVLLPGLDVPKDPAISVKGKTPIEAYLYVEIVDSLKNDALSYTVEDHWLELGITGTNGGKVYVFCQSGVPVKLWKDFSENAIGILKDNTFYVSQKLNAKTTSDALVFYGAMCECSVVSSDTASKAHAEAVYVATFQSTP